MSIKYSLGHSSSNKQKEEKEYIDYEGVAYLAVWNSKNTIAVLEPVPDTISLVVDVPEEKKADLGKLLMILPEDEFGNFKHQPKHKQFASKKLTAGYKHAVEFTPPIKGKNPSVLFQFAPTNLKAKYLRLEFSVAQLGATGVAALRAVLDDTFEELLSYEQLVANATVTRVDVAVDLIGVPMGLAVYEWPKQAKAHSYQGLGGELETLYSLQPSKSGKATNATHKVYSKTQQLKDAGQSPGFETLWRTRVEVTTHPKAKLSHLLDLSNPLQGIAIHLPPIDLPASVAQLGDHQDHWRMFVDCAARSGREYALSLLSDARKEVYRAALKHKSANIWNAKKLWGRWAHSLQRLKLVL